MAEYRDCERDRSRAAHDAAVPRRPRRQPAAPAELLHAREEFAGGRDHAEQLRAVEDDAIREVVEDAAGRRPAVRDRRRVPPRLVAHGLHLPARRDREGRRATSRSSSATSTARSSSRRPRSTSARRCTSTSTIFARGLQVPAGARSSDGVTPKLTIPSPSMVHYRGGRAAIDPSVYPGRRCSSGPT